ncbi:MAG: DUF4837 family protein [Bacteroidales bacterium]|nr:DUF4837 family protein [Bacteroidales bacterium]
MRHYISLIALLLVFASCEQKTGNGEVFKPSVTGKNGEVLVVINDDIKADTAGRYIAAMMNDDYLGLASPEPIFDLQTVPHGYFNETMQKFRNIIDVVVNDSIKRDTVLFYEDHWARPQAFISIKASSKKNLLKLVENNHIKIVSYLSKSERDRLIAFNKRTRHMALSDEIASKWNIKINVPNTFSRCTPKNNDDMSWVRIDTDESNVNLMVYDFPYVGEGSLSVPYILNKRDSLLRANIEGPDGSYMCTEIRFGLDEIVYKSGKYHKMDVAELRGLWRMEGYAMGGPFILRAHHDTISNRILVTDGFVYYPSRDRKRNLVRQLEAIMYTLEVKPTEDK